MTVPYCDVAGDITSSAILQSLADAFWLIFVYTVVCMIHFESFSNECVTIKEA